MTVRLAILLSCVVISPYFFTYLMHEFNSVCLFRQIHYFDRVRVNSIRQLSLPGENQHTLSIRRHIHSNQYFMVETNYMWLIIAVDKIAKIREPDRYQVEGVFPWKILAEYWKKNPILSRNKLEFTPVILQMKFISVLPHQREVHPWNDSRTDLTTKWSVDGISVNDTHSVGDII